MQTGRLIIDPPLGGPANMARDEALLQGCRESSPITLRCYRWDPPTISLGYFQDHDEYTCLPSPAGDLAVVRRTTGGGAILHDLELTYSIVIPIEHPHVFGRPNNLYTLIHQSIIAAVGSPARFAGVGDQSCDSSAQRGPFFCFARRHALDVVVDDAAGIAGMSKLAGSAQRRTRTAILQHGSIILGSRFPQQPVTPWASLGGPADPNDAIRLLLSPISEALDTSFHQDDWSDDELSDAAGFERMYAGDDWTIRRDRPSAVRLTEST